MSIYGHSPEGAGAKTPDNAATIDYVDSRYTAIASEFVKKDGDVMSGVLNMGYHSIQNLLDPVLDQDAVTKRFIADKYLIKTGDGMTGNLDMNFRKVIKMEKCTDGADAVNLGYLNYRLRLVDEKNLNLNGTGSMTGKIKMSGNKITGVGDPEDNDDAANKKYVDDNVIGSKGDKGDTGLKGNRVTPAYKALKVKLDHKAHEDTPVYKVKKACKETLVHKAKSDRLSKRICL